MVAMSRLGRPIARKMIPGVSWPSPAISAPNMTIATLPRKKGFSRLPRRSIRIGLSCKGIVDGTVVVVLPGFAVLGVEETPASGKAAPHLGQYFALAPGKAAEHIGH